MLSTVARIQFVGSGRLLEVCTRFAVYCRPMMNNPPPLNRDYKRDPNSKALRKKGFINHGSTLGFKVQGSSIVRFRALDV